MQTNSVAGLKVVRKDARGRSYLTIRSGGDRTLFTSPARGVMEMDVDAPAFLGSIGLVAVGEADEDGYRQLDPIAFPRKP